MGDSLLSPGLACYHVGIGGHGRRDRSPEGKAAAPEVPHQTTAYGYGDFMVVSHRPLPCRPTNKEICRELMSLVRGCRTCQGKFGETGVVVIDNPEEITDCLCLQPLMAITVH